MKNGYRAKKTGLTVEYAKKLSDMLNVYLANLQLVSIKIKNFHWNVVGVDFIDFHKELDKIYKGVIKEIDFVAERIKQLGFYPYASMENYLQVGTIKEFPSENYNTATIAYYISEDFAATAKYLRKISEEIMNSTDEDTKNHLGEALAFLEKYVWFFTAYLDKVEG